MGVHVSPILTPTHLPPYHLLLRRALLPKSSSTKSQHWEEPGRSRVSGEQAWPLPQALGLAVASGVEAPLSPSDQA